MNGWLAKLSVPFWPSGKADGFGWEADDIDCLSVCRSRARSLSLSLRGRTTKSELLLNFQLSSSFYIKMPVAGLPVAVERTLEVLLMESQLSSWKISSVGTKSSGRATSDSFDLRG